LCFFQFADFKLTDDVITNFNYYDIFEYGKKVPKVDTSNNSRLSVADIDGIIIGGTQQQELLPVDRYANNNNNNNNVSSSTQQPPAAAAPNGTLVIFFHLQKSGGTSIRKNLDHIPSVKYFFCLGFKIYNRAEIKLYEALRGENSLLNGPNKTFMIEIHAGDSPSFVTLKEKLQSWRELSLKSGVRFFAFTILRDPFSHSISHFNDHCLKRKKFCHLSKNVSLVDSFLLSKEVVNNYQTDFYTRKKNQNDPNPYFKMYNHAIRSEKNSYSSSSPTSSRTATSSSHGSINNDIDNARKVYTAMVEYLDWVGTTECIANDTFSILRNIIPTYNEETFSSHNVGTEVSSSIRQQGLSKDMFTQVQIDHLHQIMEPDYELYHNATHHFGSNCPSIVFANITTIKQ